MTDTAESDTGLQAERTALSWRRTALSAIGFSALLVHHAAEGRLDLVAASGLVAPVAVTALLIQLSAVRGRALRHSVGGVKHRQILAVALAVAVCAAVSMLTFSAPR